MIPAADRDFPLPCVQQIERMYPFSILRGATHLGMYMLLNPHERRKRPLDIIDLSSKVRCTCRLLKKLNDYERIKQFCCGLTTLDQ